MLYLIYKTTNLINGKYYIGCHQTDDLNDGYLGSGTLLRRAIQKYGEHNFKREILFEAKTPQEMFEKEKELVTIEPNSYNLRSGGAGGWDYVNSSKKNLYGLNGENFKKYAAKGQQSFAKKLQNEEYRKEYCAKVSQGMKEKYAAGEIQNGFLGKQHTDETKRLIGEKSSKSQSGSGNSQYNTMWIKNPLTQERKKIKKTEPIPDGWVKGRK